MYSHDCTLGKGEVLDQNVQPSVLIVEELPDPPVWSGTETRGQRSQSFTSTRPVPQLRKGRGDREGQETRRRKRKKVKEKQEEKKEERGAGTQS